MTVSIVCSQGVSVRCAARCGVQPESELPVRHAPGIYCRDRGTQIKYRSMPPLGVLSLRVRKRLADWYRRSTSRFRRLPDFIVIGAQKAGTSSLYFYLAQHPAIRMSALKEIHYYNYYALRGRGLSWYRSFFPLKIKSRHAITGEASPYYLFDENVPARIKRDLPNVKLIVLLRNPIDRAYSAYNMNKRQENDPDGFPTFEEAIANPDMGCEQSRLYLYRGRYAEHLRHWLKHFDREQFLFVKSEDLFRTPKKSLREVYEFLGVDETYPDDIRAQEVGSYPELSDRVRRELEDYFKDANDELIEMLGPHYRW